MAQFDMRPQQSVNSPLTSTIYPQLFCRIACVCKKKEKFIQLFSGVRMDLK